METKEQKINMLKIKIELLKDDLNTIDCVMDNMIENCLKYVQVSIQTNITVNNKISVFNEINKTTHHTNFALGELLSMKTGVARKKEELEQEIKELENEHR